MRIIADLHIHSRYSRATSSKLTPPYLERWARIKGLDLLGSGDCTHPVWLKELREQLEDAEEGLYILKNQARDDFDAGPALSEGIPNPRSDRVPRFVLTGEISTIYKKGDKTRKVHHLVILPDFKAAAAFQTSLERRGNITSDGRPILGIDSQDLLAMLLDADERAMLIPAHIWTPWFSALGAKSGFDSIDACYGDLSSFIWAVETGLSSNPPMNWALESLDRFAIISNSDAHSPEKLAREGTVFELERPLSLPVLSAALAGDVKQGRIQETIEFFPQEGKYHYDGHRKCRVYLNPEEAAASDGICPVCHKALTRGVMGRVLELADRPVDEEAPYVPQKEDANHRPYRSLIPLKELLGELLETGTASKKVESLYGILIEKVGNELSLLMDTPVAELEKVQYAGVSGELLACAITRMRQGQVSIIPGYDGEYGIIRAFPPGEKREIGKEADFFSIEAGASSDAERIVSKKESMPGKERKSGKAKAEQENQDKPLDIAKPAGFKPFNFDREQEKAILYEGKHAIIIAGPGAGKTATLAARIAHLVQKGIEPETIAALSFTVKAALELRERITKTVGTETGGITTTTFHALCALILREQTAQPFKILSDAERDALLQEIVADGIERIRPEGLGKYIEARQRFLLLPGACQPHVGTQRSLSVLAEELGIPATVPEREQLYHVYYDRLHAAGSLDFDGLVAETVRLFVENPTLLLHYQERFRSIFVDEYQDINFAQYVLIRLLAPSDVASNHQELWVIGDPNQAIYGFRGSDKRFIDRFLQDYPQAALFRLTQSFRCAAPIIEAAGQLMDTRLKGTKSAVRLFRSEHPTEKSEAEGIARRIARLIGGTSFFAFDSDMVDSSEDQENTHEEQVAELSGLDECAILLRTTALAAPIVKALRDHGLPFKLTGEKPWWEEEPVTSLLGFLRHSLHQQDTNQSVSHSIIKKDTTPAEAVTLAWEFLNRQGIVKHTSTKLRKIQDSLGQSIDYVIQRLIDIAALYDDIHAFLDTLTVSDASGGAALHREGVQIMSIHASKGLEFEHVFVAALEDGLVPFTLYETKKTGLSSEHIEEEKRLLYVAMTRAKTGLYLSWAQKRNFQGRQLENRKSPFLNQLETIIPLYQEQDRRTRSKDFQLSLF